MTIKIYLDGADLSVMRSWADDPRVEGFTTNPSLARASGVVSYRAFAERALAIAGGRPVSIEVLADDLEDMEWQARVIAALGDSAFVKIPVVNSKRQSTAALVRRLAEDGIRLNVTAVFTREQVRRVGHALKSSASPAVVSVFAGRVADSGVDPSAHVAECCRVLRDVCPRAHMLWASARQIYDVLLAERTGCDVITLPGTLLSKLRFFGRDLEEYSCATAAEFYVDSCAAGFEL